MSYKILRKEKLNDTVVRMDILAPMVARHAKPGQFIVLRVDEEGERIPLTIYKTSGEIVSIIYQIVGYTTMKLDQKQVGDEILTFVGPLGKASNLDGYKNALVIGGGVGSAIAYPIARGFKELESNVDVLLGFRSKDLVILEDEFKDIANDLYIYTDDGSYKEKGFVTSGLEKLVSSGKKYDVCFVVGPIIMMKNISLLTKKYGIKTIVSMNPLMIDGTGMCGCCRVTVDGKMKFACIDGPDFDGHLVDYDELMTRNKMYFDIEKRKREVGCNLFRGINDGK